MIKLQELKTKIDNLGYIATDELLYDTYNALCMFNDGVVDQGQDIYAICLEGPPGAGKTEFAKTYTKICTEIFKDKVEMVDYQCDATTGKTELFEEINISAAIRGDADNVNIPGKLIDAINKVNTGSKVILFIDEYDKAREETDAFLLQFLQSGKINSSQHGDLEVKEEYKSNLQVILCKNDMREELSGPLSRRIRIIRLDYMTPENFHIVANRALIDNKKDKVDSGLLNLVILMYQKAYSSKELYNRLPSCSEMLIALVDANRLLTRANAPQSIIYNTIIRNMFKSLDDIKTFEKSIQSGRDNLSTMIENMKNTKEETEEIDFNRLIAQQVFKEEGNKLAQRSEEMQQLIDEYKEKFTNADLQQQKEQKIALDNGTLVLDNNYPKAMSNFEDQSLNIKRGHNIYDISEDWATIGELSIPDLSHYYLIQKLTEIAAKQNITIYENGILLYESAYYKLIVIKEFDENNKTKYKFLSNQPIISYNHLKYLYDFAINTYQINTEQIKIVNKNPHSPNGNISINTLVYNPEQLDSNKVDENIYNIQIDESLENVSDLKKQLTTTINEEDALKRSREIMSKGDL